MKLYKVEITALPDEARVYYVEEEGDYLDAYCADPDWTPEGWLEDDERRAEWIARHGDTRFYWPSTGRLYQSRSGAKARADLIRAYGATVEVVESEPIVWLTPERRRLNRITELEAELAALREAS